ncbi:hypothetical protein [Pantanalinema sp. GBBB05]|uniref:hypothetical protein n=1 Tax=Pantanalinema sp. GBBB05 TaxID=2604139 RepID=UPI001E14C57A|nr:hypothetical protein [Pantanalinema sp. GBBB05]
MAPCIICHGNSMVGRDSSIAIEAFRMICDGNSMVGRDSSIAIAGFRMIRCPNAIVTHDIRVVAHDIPYDPQSPLNCG